VEATGAFRVVYLRPGEFCFGEDMLRISTVLGFCISIPQGNGYRAANYRDGAPLA
jgi:hypothetical protein